MGMFDTDFVRYVMDSLPPLEETLRLTRPTPKWPVKTSSTKVWVHHKTGRKVPMADWPCPNCDTWNDSQARQCVGCSGEVEIDFIYGYSLGCDDVKQLLLKLKTE